MTRPLPTSSTSTSSTPELRESTVSTTTTAATPVRTNVDPPQHRAPTTVVVMERYLLARTKDERYVEECTKLLRHIRSLPPVRLLFQKQRHGTLGMWSWWCRLLRCWRFDQDNGTSQCNSLSSTVTNRSNHAEEEEEEGDASTDSFSEQQIVVLEYISWMLYILLTTKSHSHNDHDNSSSRSNNDSFSNSITTPGMEICQVEYSTTPRTGSSSTGNSSNNNNTTTTNRSSSASLSRKVPLLLSLLYHRTTSVTTRLLSMTTIWYGIRLWSCHVQQKERRRQQQHQHQQRSIQNYNRLTGPSRQDVFHRQRLEMIRRGNDVPYNSTELSSTSSPPTTDHGRNESTASVLVPSLSQRIRNALETFIVSIDTAIQSLPLDGPHYPTPSSATIGPPVRIHTAIDTNHAIATTTTTTTPVLASNETTLVHTIRWIYQFYMAYYYVCGNYPSILHQLFGVRPATNANTVQPWSSTGRTVIPVIGKLIMLQLSWKLLLYGVSQPMVDYWFKMKPQVKQLWRSMTKTLGITRRRRREQKYLYMEGVSPIPTCTPPINSDKNDAVKDLNDQPLNVLVCGICRNSGSATTNDTLTISNRNSIIFPSCSIKCGHVFCWYCIQQWLTYYDTKCPICRTICTTNDVQLLYNF